jgi:hypothetical protein
VGEKQAKIQEPDDGKEAQCPERHRGSEARVIRRSNISWLVGRVRGHEVERVSSMEY